MLPLDRYIKTQLDAHLFAIEELLDADAVSIISPIIPGLERRLRDALEQFDTPKPRLAIVHATQGGIAEVVERMVETIRHTYDHVVFLIPDKAMSAGTIFALSGDRILMDHFSCLGPIDPQIVKDGRLVPALSYLNQFERLNEKARNGTLTSAEYALLSKMDLGELYQFEQARELSKELLIKWLTNYKFKDWDTTQTRRIQVTDHFREERAAEIALALNNTDRWHSHGRGIDMETLVSEIGLRVEDFSVVEGLVPVLKEYYELLVDYMSRGQIESFIHTVRYF